MLRHGMTALARRSVLAVRARRSSVAPRMRDRGRHRPPGLWWHPSVTWAAGARGSRSVSRHITCHPPSTRAPHSPPSSPVHPVRALSRRRRRRRLRRVEERGRHAPCAVCQIPTSPRRHQASQYLHAVLLHGTPRASSVIPRTMLRDGASEAGRLTLNPHQLPSRPTPFLRLLLRGRRLPPAACHVPPATPALALIACLRHRTHPPHPSPPTPSRIPATGLSTPISLC